MKRKISITLLISIITLQIMTMSANRKFTLVIDAGHGGHDSGALGAISKEKDINLNVALAFGNYVEKYCPDVRVIYTRKTDIFIPLKQRANIANKNNADLFISVHTNSLPGGKQAYGQETYTLGMHRAADNLDVAKRENSVILIEKDYKHRYQGFNPNSAESYIMFEFMQDKNMAKSVDLAKMVQQQVCTTANRPNKGVHQAGFLVLRETSMPSCLIELGFITTPTEENLLNDKNAIDNIARGIYKAFQSYKNKYSNNIVVPFKANNKQNATITPIIPDEYKKNNTARKINTENKKNIGENTKTDNIIKTDNIYTDSTKFIEKQKTQNQEQPIFKVQILASNVKIQTNEKLLKGVTEVEIYEENNIYKYTKGADRDFHAINKLRKELKEIFPGAFIVAFKSGKKINVNKAIEEFNSNKLKK